MVAYIFNPAVHDIHEIAELMWKAWKSDGFILERDPVEWINYLHGKIPDSPWQSFVTERKSKITGFISLCPTDSGEAQHLSPWLSNLFVLEEERNQGLATLLEKAVEDEARQRGFLLIHTWAAPGSENYHQRQGYIWLDKPLNIMVKELA